jgi:uncharacterized protein (TIGR02452 family)
MTNLTREQLTDIATDTLAILEQGHYTNAKGKQRSISRLIRSCVEHTECFTPENLAEVLEEKIVTNRYDTKIELTNETTLQASYRLLLETDKTAGGILGRPGKILDDSVLALNFASATSPGGGFLHGSKAQEESIARSSGLYSSLINQPQFYEANKNLKSSLYTNHIILSPYVPVFKDDDGNPLNNPYLVSVLTVPAVNINSLKGRDANLLMGPDENQYGGEVYHTMGYRMASLLALAHFSWYNTLVLGAWGCGAFGNDPKLIAELFQGNLQNKFRGVFKRIVFAVFDTSEEQDVYKAFAERFAG